MIHTGPPHLVRPEEGVEVEGVVGGWEGWEVGARELVAWILPSNLLYHLQLQDTM